MEAVFNHQFLHNIIVHRKLGWVYRANYIRFTVYADSNIILNYSDVKIRFVTANKAEHLRHQHTLSWSQRQSDPPLI